jgi:hypothetical protein
VEDRLLPLKQTAHHPLDPPKSFLKRKARQTELEEWDVPIATRSAVVRLDVLDSAGFAVVLVETPFGAELEDEGSPVGAPWRNAEIR